MPPTREKILDELHFAVQYRRGDVSRSQENTCATNPDDRVFCLVRLVAAWR